MPNHFWLCYSYLFEQEIQLILIRTSYKSQNYWVFGLCPLSGIQKTRKHIILETGSVSVLR
jgi:hypothetical protein